MSPNYQPFNHIRDAIKTDPGYAWVWYCNLVMPMIDRGIPREKAQSVCVAIMSNFFDYNLENHPQFIEEKQGLKK